MSGLRNRHRRLLVIGGVLGVLGVSGAMALTALRDNLMYFYTPVQIAAGEAPHKGHFRLGGLVQAGSIQREAGSTRVSFVVTDQQRQVTVRYSGALPDLFEEGHGVIAQGSLGPGGDFMATQVLAKHDENYMPPEVAEGMRKAAARQP